MNPYPYSVPFKRTPLWYNGDWAMYSEWCKENLGDNWEYFNDSFVFTEEKYKQWFLLRWS